MRTVIHFNVLDQLRPAPPTDNNQLKVDSQIQSPIAYLLSTLIQAFIFCRFWLNGIDNIFQSSKFGMVPFDFF